MKTKKEVEEMMDEYACDGKNFTGMNYKDGINDALRWVLGEMSDKELLTGDED